MPSTFMLRAILCCLLMAGLHASLYAASEPPAADEKKYQVTIRPLLKKYCLRCHGAKKPKADLRIDTLGPDLAVEKTAAVWHELRDRVNLGQMPPKGAAQPSQKELTQISEWITRELRRVRAA